MSVTVTETHKKRREQRSAATIAKYLAKGMSKRDAKAEAERKHPVKYNYTVRLDFPGGTKTEPGYGFATEEAARAAGETRELQLLEAHKAKLEGIKPRVVEVPSIGKWLPDYRDAMISRKRADKTIQCRMSACRLIVRRIGADTKLDQIDAKVRDNLQLYMATHYSDAHRSNVMQALSNMLRVALDYKLIREMPCTFASDAQLKTDKSKVVRIDREQFFSDEEFDLLLANAPHLHAEVCFLLGREAGMRAGEMAGYDWADVLTVDGKFPTKSEAAILRILRSRWFGIPEADLKVWRDACKESDPAFNEHDRTTWPKSVSRPKRRWLVKYPKSKKGRELGGMPDRLRVKLRQLWLASGKPTTGRVLGGSVVAEPCEGDVYHGTMRGWLEAAERAAGLKPTPLVRPRKDNGAKSEIRLAYGHLHKLRHSFCSALAMRNIPVKTIQMLAGHHSVTVTEGYMWLAPGAKADAMAALNHPAPTQAEPSAVDEDGDSNQHTIAPVDSTASALGRGPKR